MRRTHRYCLVVALAVACSSAPILLTPGEVPKCRDVLEEFDAPDRAHVERAILARRWIAKTDTDEIEWVDPETLRPVGRRRVPIPTQSWSGSLNADGHTLAVGGGRVRIVDGRSMRVIGATERRVGSWDLAWVGDALAAPDRTVLRWFDAAGRLLSRTELAARPVAGSATEEGYVALLEGGTGGATPAMLVYAMPGGEVRRVVVDRIAAGHDPDLGEYGTMLTPALAVAPAGDRAIILPPGGPIVDVDLDSMEITYDDDRRAGTIPTATAKLADWSGLEAQWLSNDRIAFWGEGASISEPGSSQGHAYGLSILDLRSWTTCVIDPTVVDVVISDEVLIARSTGGEAGNDDALVAYDTAGNELWRRYGHRRMFDISAYGPFAYATMSWNGWAVRILDARTGEFIALRRHRPPTLFEPAGEPFGD